MTVDDPGTNPASFPGAEAPGTTVVVDPGAYNVTETGPSGYASTFSADCSGTIAVGETKTCTVTNGDVQPKLIVIKHVINDNGGSASAGDFTMTVTGNDPNPASFPGAEAPGTTVALNAGNYDVTEAGPSGYAASFSADCTGSVALGQTKTCTVTNDDVAPQLIVIKHVVNDNGGTAVAGDFTMTVTGNNPSPASFPGAEAPGTTVTLNAGSYGATETGPSGYAASFSADCTGSIAVGDTKTCTVTNDDVAPKLIVIKHVINDNGGTAAANDFTMTVNPTPASFPGAEAPGTTVTLDAGNYVVTEAGPSGYFETHTADCTGTIAIGETKTCTVTNNDIAPQLIVIKHVINDNGGTAAANAFTMTVDDPDANPASFPGAEAPGTTVVVDPGDYTVTETGPSGYAASFSADFTGSIAIGETKTCTVTNNDIAPTLTVNKVLVPSSDPGKFNLLIDGTTAGTGANVGNGGTTGPVAVNAGSHTVSETAGTGTDLSDYVTTINGDCATTGAVTLALAENKTCTITNTRRGKATVLKTTNGVVNPSLDLQFVLTGPELPSGGITSSTLNDADGLLEFGGTKLIPGSTYTICARNVPAGFSSLWMLDIDRDGDFDVITPYNTDAGTGPWKPLLRLHRAAGRDPGVQGRQHPAWRRAAHHRLLEELEQVHGRRPGHQRRPQRRSRQRLLPRRRPAATADRRLQRHDVPAGGQDPQQAGPKSRSSDAAYELAAQLLAAKLNLAAGAETCSSVDTAVMQGQALLDQINFNGSGTYLTSKFGSPTLRATALNLAATLDKYNNGNLC